MRSAAEGIWVVFEDPGTDLLGVSLAEAEEFFREMRDRNPDEYERIRSLRDGIRTAMSNGQGKVLVMCRAGNFVRLYVRDLTDQPVDIDTMDALKLLQCGPEEPPVNLPENLNPILDHRKAHV